MRYVRYVIILIILSFSIKGYATHVVGGDLQYRCLGNNRYEITLYFLRDCINGNPETDVPAIVSFFDIDYDKCNLIGKGGFIYMYNYEIDTLYDFQSDPCFSASGITCVERTVYRDTVTLPFREGGYRVLYQRCCRNILVQNILDPLNTGSTYETYITEEALQVCNSGPQLNQFPKLYVCVNKQFVFNQSFTDADGDSIVYSLCVPNAGATREDPKPDQDPYLPIPKIEWKNGYSTQDMLNNPADPVRISDEGIITGTPLYTGTYLIGFCIKEYRNGELLTVSNRDFELTVLPCEAIPDAEIGLPGTICDGTTVEFINNSTGAQHYKWFFDLSDATLTSNEETPTYTYQDTGCYEIMLIATYDSTCFDTAQMTLCVYNDNLNASFGYNIIGECSDSVTYSFYNTSTDSSSAIASSDWEIKFDSNTVNLSGDTVSYTFFTEGTATVSLITTTANGCAETVSQEIDVNLLTLELAYGDSISICLGSETELIKNGNPDYTYTYEPEAGLDLSNPYNPIASPDTSTTYIITVINGACTVSDSVYVKVRGEDFEILDLSDSCDIFRTLTTNNTHYTEIKWSTNPEFDPVLSTDDTLEIEVRIDESIYVSVVDTFLNCTLIKSIDLTYPGPHLNYSDSLVLCRGSETELIIDGNPDYTYTYEPETGLDLTDPSNPIVSPDSSIVYIMTVSNGVCILKDTIYVEVKGGAFDIVNLSDSCNIHKILTTDNSTHTVIKWSTNPGFNPVLSTVDTLEIDVPYSETIYVSIQDTSVGCTIIDSINIVHAGLNLEYPETVMLCLGDETQVTLVNQDPDDNFSVLWEDSPFIVSDLDKTTITVSGVQVGTEQLIFFAEADNGCTLSDTITLIVSDTTAADFSFINECGSLVVDFTNLSDFDDVTWDFGDGNTSSEENPNHTYEQPGTYSVTLILNDGCSSSVTKIITVDEFEVNELPGQVSSCFGNSVQLNPGGNPDLNYHWEPPTGLDDPSSYNPTATITDSTLYYVTITDDDTDCKIIDSVLVIPVDTFTVTASPDVRVCVDDPVTIMASSSEGTIVWTDENGEPVGTGMNLTVNPGESDYYVASTTVLGCTVSDTVYVSFIDFSDVLEATADPDTIDFGDSTQLDVLGGASDYVYEWRDENNNIVSTIKNPKLRPKETTTYCVTVIDTASTGCEATECVTVVVRSAPCQPPYIFLPNAFSPNGDGDNDVLYVRGEPITDLYLIIYNRWGEQVFSTRDPSIGWDGRDKNGKIMPDDVYGYYFRATCEDGNTYEEKGNVSLLR